MHKVLPETPELQSPKAFGGNKKSHGLTSIRKHYSALLPGLMKIPNEWQCSKWKWCVKISSNRVLFVQITPQAWSGLERLTAGKEKLLSDQTEVNKKERYAWERRQAALQNEKYRNSWPALARQFTQERWRLERTLSREIPAKNGSSETMNKSIRETRLARTLCILYTAKKGGA